MRLCACGCGGEIIEQYHHKYYGVPKFIYGHQSKIISEQTRRKISASLMGHKRTLGYKHSEETRQKMSIAHKGKVFSKETRNKLSEVLKGKTVSEKTRKIMSEARKGKVLTKECKEKISIAMIGRKFSEEWKKKISEAMKGKIHSAEWRRKNSESKKGKKVSLETRMKMSKMMKGKRVGDKNPNWLGGKSFEPYNHHFNNSLKEKIRNRDSRLCQLCGKTEKENKRKLAVHHIDYVKENCNEENLLSLCMGCNIKVNVNRIFWTGFFVGYILSRNKFV